MSASEKDIEVLENLGRVMKEAGAKVRARMEEVEKFRLAEMEAIFDHFEPQFPHDIRTQYALKMERCHTREQVLALKNEVLAAANLIITLREIQSQAISLAKPGYSA